MRPLLERLRAGGTVVGDGGWGTELMARGLPAGVCPELWNLERPEELAAVAEAYVEAGAELVTTNTFGGSPLRLASYGLDDRTEEINRRAVEICAAAAGGSALVSASVGPTGRLLKPYGDTEPGEVRDAFARQIAALLEAGADVVCVETMIDLVEARLAVEAARSLPGRIPVIATMTFDRTPRGFFTAMGVSTEQAVEGLADAGADVVGSNCGHGIETMVEIAGDLALHSSLPLAIQSNAGLPVLRGDEIRYPEDPTFWAGRAAALVDAGVALVGGCCGTGPDHIRALRRLVDERRGREH